MTESSFKYSLLDQIIGSLYATLYYTVRQRILGFAIDGWLKNLPLIFALFAWLFGMGLGWAIFGILLAVVLRLLYWRGKRAGYIRFISEENQQGPVDAESIHSDQKVAVLASGTFSVRDWETYVRQHPAQYWRVGMGDHAIMVNYSSGRFLYQFIQPGKVEEVVLGQLCAGRKALPALEITYLSNWGPESMDVSFMFYEKAKEEKPAKLRRKIYLSFEDLETRGAVWKNLTKDLAQSTIKES